jgi:osmotically-inducible protein OsmY
MTSIAAAVLLGLSGLGSASAADWDDMTQEARDAYRHGQIWATYAIDPVLATRDIDVDVEGNTVILHGTVETPVEKILAGAIAQAADGVTKVDNQLKVDPEMVVMVTTVVPSRAYAQKVADASVAARVNSMLLWNQYTDGLGIAVSAHDGKVTLRGVADTPGAKQRAGEIAANARGVTSVDNQLRVDGSMQASSNDQRDPEWIEDKIEDSYLYSYIVNSAALDAEADDEGNVTISGQVRSPMEKAMAIELAQGVTGVKHVDASDVTVASS